MRAERRKVDVGIFLEVLLGCPQECVFVQISMFASELFHKALKVSIMNSYW